MKRFKKYWGIVLLLNLFTITSVVAKGYDSRDGKKICAKIERKNDLRDIKKLIKNFILKRHKDSSDFTVVKVSVLADNNNTGKWTKVEYITDKSVQGNIIIIENGKLILSSSQKFKNNTVLKFLTLDNGQLELLIKDKVAISCSGDCDCSISGTFPPPQG